ncbi:MAG TPA: hypothetical protein VJB70_03105 [Candidatus Paceibacterota bacterium]
MMTGKNHIIFFVIVGVFLFGVYALENGMSWRKPYPELASVTRYIGSFGELSRFFKNIAEDKGAPYAFEILKKSSFPTNIDLHLLAHVVGDELYKQKSIGGIAFCTNDFRNACSHSIVVGTLLEFGEGALPRIKEACHKAPGGKGAYTMCFHGLGHGVLAFYGYDLPQALLFCEKTGTSEYNNREYIECAGGAIMELVSGGFHDTKAWENARTIYFSKEDPLYPCSASFMSPTVRPVCYNYITTRLWEYVGGSIGYPTAEFFSKSFPICATISDSIERKECYGGFGKEFIGLSLGRDIRLDSFLHFPKDSLEKINDWCLLAGKEEGVRSCMLSAADSLYWGGENHRSIVIRFCLVVEEGDDWLGKQCFDRIINNVSFYIHDSVYRSEFCQEIPAHYHEPCKKSLL